MEIYKRDFIKFAIRAGALKFGQHELKSNRMSPYFFDTGAFQNGFQLVELGKYYAEAIVRSRVIYEGLFGPAYKGIQLVTATSIALWNMDAINAPCTFNRKEEKRHGEGGLLVGAPLRKNRVLIVDDTITTGGTQREAIDIIKKADAVPAGVIIAFDREERGKCGKLSSVQQVRKEAKIPVVSIIELADVIEHLREMDSPHLARVEEYREKYGA